MKTYAPPKLRQVVTEAVFRRSRVFLLTVFAVLTITLVAIVLMHKRYQAEAKLVVQNLRSQAPLTTSPSEHLMTPNNVSTTEINNEVDLLQSAGVARVALGDRGSGAESEADQRKVADLQKRLTVEPVHQSSTIDVKLTSDSPEHAAAQLKAVLEAYYLQRAGTAQSGDAAEFFNAQAESKAKDVDEDQKNLTNFEVQHQIADLDDQTKIQVNRVAALQDQLFASEATLAGTQSRLNAERRQLAATPPRTRTTERMITNQYSQEHLSTELVDLQNRLTELRKRYPATDRQVIETQDKINNIRAAIAAQGSSPAGDQATDVNPTYQQLNTAMAITTADLSANTAQRAELAEQLKQAKARLTELQESTADYDTLKRKLAQSRSDYTTYAQKRDEAKVSEALDNAKMFDVTTVQEPMASPDPVRPKPVLYLAAGLAFALFLATLLALYADTSAEQVYTPAQLDQLTGTRTIATFADEDDADHHEDRNRLEYRRILVAIRSALGADDATAVRAVHTGHDEALQAANGAPVGYCIAFTSALAHEGVSYLVANMATEAARQASSRVAVLDMDMLLRKFEAEENVSFGMKYNQQRSFWTLALNGDKEITIARPGGTQGQFAARLRPLLVEARKEFDYLFLDCPSLQASTLASELDICVDGYVAVVSAGKARKQNVEQLAATLKETRAPMLGFVLNRRRYPVPGWLHRLIW